MNRLKRAWGQLNYFEISINQIGHSLNFSSSLKKITLLKPHIKDWKITKDLNKETKELSKIFD